MKHMNSFIAALTLTAMVIINVSSGFAQEWHVLLGQGIFHTSQLSKEIESQRIGPKNWLASQTPLLKNTPLTSVSQSANPIEEVPVDPEYLQVGSWAPFQTLKGKENFTLFTF